MFTTTSKDAVSVILLGALPLGGIWRLCVDLLGEGIVEVKLRRKLITPLGRRIGANLEVNVDRSAGVPTGIDCNELDGSICVRHLIAAQELFPDGTETWVRYVRIDAQRVTVPNVHGCASQGRTGATINLRDMKDQTQRYSLLNRTV